MIEIVQGDITKLDVDAIVNAANSALAGGGGVDGAINDAAGPELVVASRALAPCPTGRAVITPGFRLPARFVIHAVGPIWYGGKAREPELLRETYESAFRVAREQGSIRSIAFPAISTGIYGYPKEPAARIALEVMRAHEADFTRIVACVFGKESLEIYERVMKELPR